MIVPPTPPRSYPPAPMSRRPQPDDPRPPKSLDPDADCEREYWEDTFAEAQAARKAEAFWARQSLEDHSERLPSWLLGGVVVILLIIAGISYAWSKDVAVGDSIAKGTGAALHVETHAIVGASSCKIIGLVPAGHYDHAVISSGINDGGRCNGAVRARLDASVVVWILPAPINAGLAAVRAVARQYGDRTVRYDCAGPCTRSNFHPGSYAKVAQWVRTKWANGSLPPVLFVNPPVKFGR